MDKTHRPRPTLTLIQGGLQDTQQRLRRLQEDPCSLGIEEFEAELDELGCHLTFPQKVNLVRARAACSLP